MEFSERVNGVTVVVRENGDVAIHQGDSEILMDIADLAEIMERIVKKIQD